MPRCPWLAGLLGTSRTADLLARAGPLGSLDDGGAIRPPSHRPGVWVQRRHSGFGAYLVASMLVLAAGGSYQIREAWAPSSYDFNLQAPSGVESHNCYQTQPLPIQVVGNGGDYLTVYNGTSAPVGLVITPLNGADINWSVPSNGSSKCGVPLANGAICYLLCQQTPG